MIVLLLMLSMLAYYPIGSISISKSTSSSDSEFLTHAIISSSDLGFAAIKAFAQKGGDLTINDNLLFRFAVLLGKDDIVQYLLDEHPVDPSAVNNEAIRSAAEYNHIAIARALLSDDRVDLSVAENILPNLNYLVNDIIMGEVRVSYYPIIIASVKGHWEMVQQFLDSERLRGDIVHVLEAAKYALDCLDLFQKTNPSAEPFIGDYQIGLKRLVEKINLESSRKH